MNDILRLEERLLARQKGRRQAGGGREVRFRLDLGLGVLPQFRLEPRERLALDDVHVGGLGVGGGGGPAGLGEYLLQELVGHLFRLIRADGPSLQDRGTRVQSHTRHLAGIARCVAATIPYVTLIKNVDRSPGRIRWRLHRGCGAQPNTGGPIECF